MNSLKTFPITLSIVFLSIELTDYIYYKISKKEKVQNNKNFEKAFIITSSAYVTLILSKGYL